MLYLEQEDKDRQVSMYFNSPGGTVSAGLALYDCMQAMSYPIATLNLGLAASMGAFLMGAGTKGMRMSLPNARFLLQAPSMMDPVRGQASDIAIEVKHILNQRERVINGICKFTGKGYDEVKKDLKRDMYLTAPEGKQLVAGEAVFPCSASDHVTMNHLSKYLTFNIYDFVLDFASQSP